MIFVVLSGWGRAQPDALTAMPRGCFSQWVVCESPRWDRRLPVVPNVEQDTDRWRLLRRGLALEYATLGWNVVGIVVLAITAVTARSVALAGFGLDSLIEIGASTVVIWELSGTGETRQRRALRLIGGAFALLALYLAVQSTLVLVTDYHPQPSTGGIVWTTVTAVVMVGLAAGKARTGAALDNPVLRTEGRVTLVDGLLAVAVLAGLVLNAAASWWWADPVAGYVLLAYATHEVYAIFIAHD
jgi:divalent metal cation (Fe/Co/Zn/Cd) transporter